MMKYLKTFNEKMDSTEYDFNKSTYLPEDKSIIAAYMLLEESDASIKVMNIKEIRNHSKTGPISYMSGKESYTPIIKKIDLPKSQIEILGDVSDKEGFKWLKIPYWLFKKNIDLSIKRLEGKYKRPYILDKSKIDSEAQKYFDIVNKGPESSKDSIQWNWGEDKDKNFSDSTGEYVDVEGHKVWVDYEPNNTQETLYVRARGLYYRWLRSEISSLDKNREYYR